MPDHVTMMKVLGLFQVLNVKRVLFQAERSRHKQSPGDMATLDSSPAWLPSCRGDRAAPLADTRGTVRTPSCGPTTGPGHSSRPCAV